MAEIWIDEFQHADDGDDWLPAFNRIQAEFGSYSPKTALAQAAPKYPYRGFTLRFSARSCRFSGPLEIRCPMALIGCGGLASNAGTILMFPKGKRGIIVHGVNTIHHAKFADRPVTGNPDDPAYDGDSNAAGTIIEKLMVLAIDPDTGGEAKQHILFDQRQSTRRPMAGAHGITLLAHAILRDVGVSHFDGHGIYIYGLGGGADVTVPEVSALCGLTQGQNVYITGCGGDGLHIFGHDANVCTFTGLQAVNCYGWGIRDLSRLGQNTFIGCQAAYNALGGICRPYALFTSDFDGLAQLLTEDIAHKDGMIAERQARLADPAIDPALAAILQAEIATTQGQRADEARIVPVLPGAIAAVRAAMLAAFTADPAANPAPPDKVHYADLTLPTDSMAAGLLWTRLSQYHASLLAESRQIAAEVDNRLLALGQPAAAEHLCATMFDNPYGDGGNLFASVYAEGNGPGEGFHHQISIANMCLNSVTLTNVSEAIGFSTQDFKASIDGAVVAATRGVESGGSITARGDIHGDGPISSNGDIIAAGDLAGKGLTLSTLGGPVPAVQITAGGLPRGPLAAGATLGSIMLNTNPKVGQPIGWVMTANGWAKFGPISRLPKGVL